MADMTKTIAPKSDQLNADDMISGPRTIKITKVLLTSGKDSDAQPVAIHFDGDNGKPYKPCKSMRRVLVQLWGGDGAQYVGRSMTLYRDDKVLFGGAAVGGIRISHMSHINEAVTVALTMSKQSRKPYTVKPLPGANGATAKPQEPEAPAPAADPKLIEAGRGAAGLGVAEYTKWLATLTPEQKTTVRSYHAAWSTSAKEADKAALASLESEEQEDAA